MGYEEKIGMVYKNINRESSINYDNIEDILDILISMSEYTKDLEDRIFELEMENK